MQFPRASPCQISIFIDTGMSCEAFKSINSVFPKSFQIRNIPRNRATPETNVNRELPFCCNSLYIEVFKGCRRRIRVKRHVENRCNSTGECGASRTLIAFPFCPAWLVNMNMRVHEPWHQHLVVRNDNFFHCINRSIELIDSIDNPIANAHCTGTNSIREDGPLCSNNKVYFLSFHVFQLSIGQSHRDRHQGQPSSLASLH